MKIELTEGCICDSFEVDGKPIMDCNESKLKYLLVLATQKICCKEFTPDQKVYAENILREMVVGFPDTYKCSDEPCECCGDYIDTYTMEI